MINLPHWLVYPGKLLVCNLLTRTRRCGKIVVHKVVISFREKFPTEEETNILFELFYFGLVLVLFTHTTNCLLLSLVCENQGEHFWGRVKVCLRHMMNENIYTTQDLRVSWGNARRSESRRETILNYHTKLSVFIFSALNRILHVVLAIMPPFWSTSFVLSFAFFRR